MAEVHGSVEELLAGASHREPMAKHVDSLSGSGFERVVVDGERYVLKYLGYPVDWIARALDDRDCFALTLWRRGILDALPGCIDHTIVGVARAGDDGRVALLMRDVGEFLVPPGSGPVDRAAHDRFLEHLAVMHAQFWDFTDDDGLLPPALRYTALTPATARREAEAGNDDPVPRALPAGWKALRDKAPEAHRYAAALTADPAALLAALDATPATFIHGDWKFGNLGTRPDGRTILLDWAWPGRAGPLVDLAWYLAVNCDRLPVTKEQTLTTYRGYLEAQGIATRDWWDRQLDLALLGGFLQLGWSKTGDPVELDWWVRRVTPVARELLR